MRRAMRPSRWLATIPSRDALYRDPRRLNRTARNPAAGRGGRAPDSGCSQLPVHPRPSSCEPGPTTLRACATEAVAVAQLVDGPRVSAVGGPSFSSSGRPCLSSCPALRQSQRRHNSSLSRLLLHCGWSLRRPRISLRSAVCNSRDHHDVREVMSANWSPVQILIFLGFRGRRDHPPSRQLYLSSYLTALRAERPASTVPGVSRRLFRLWFATRLGPPRTRPRTQVTRRRRPGDHRDQVPRTPAPALDHLPSLRR